jgi:hypothetical protein
VVNAQLKTPDPADYEVIETRFKLANLELASHLEKMKRELT